VPVTNKTKVPEKKVIEGITAPFTYPKDATGFKNKIYYMVHILSCFLFVNLNMCI